MALQVNEVLTKHGLNVRGIAYIKDKRGNLSTMTQALISIISCERLSKWHNHLWGHVGGMMCVATLALGSRP
jgi:hypothetical protein